MGIDVFYNKNYGIKLSELSLGMPQIIRHQMTVNGKTDDFTKDDLLAVARSMNIRKPIDIIDTIVSAVSEWDTVAKDCGVPEGQRKAISATHLLKW
jgi:serine/threonine-protein kinase HipA